MAQRIRGLPDGLLPHYFMNASTATGVRLERIEKHAEVADRQMIKKGSWMKEGVQTIQRVLVGNREGGNGAATACEG